MINNLSDDPDDDAPVKVAYHKAPISEELEKSEESDTPDKLAESEPIEEEDPLDNEDLEETPTEDTEDDEKDPLDEEDDLAEPELTPVPTSDPNEYYLQTVKAGEQPEWPQPKENLSVFSQPIDDGLMQYFAYPKDLGKAADDVPNAEIIAKTHKSDSPVIIIDQVGDHLTPGCCLELILAKNGHALAKTDSNLDNLEANITSLIDMAKMNFGLNVEHFISTSNVSPEVEKRLDDLEDAGDKSEDPQTAVPANNLEQASVYQTSPSSISDQPILAPKGDRSKLAVFIPVLILIIIAGVMVYYRHNLLSIINPPKQEAEIKPVPTETPTPTPTIVVERSKYTVRVLNGTPTTGAAGVLADKLKEKGWLIDRTGNATSSAIAESYVRGKVDLTDVIKALIADVSDYQATPSAVILKSTDKADLEFVIGKK